MSEILFSIGYVLSAATIGAGLALLILHVWVLASKLSNTRADGLSAPSRLPSHGRGNEGRAQQ
jgi:hypothetical protein